MKQRNRKHQGGAQIEIEFERGYNGNVRTLEPHELMELATRSAVNEIVKRYAVLLDGYEEDMRSVIVMKWMRTMRRYKPKDAKQATVYLKQAAQWAKTSEFRRTKRHLHVLPLDGISREPAYSAPCGEIGLSLYHSDREAYRLWQRKIDGEPITAKEIFQLREALAFIKIT